MPLNPALFKVLKHNFREVEIADEGCSMLKKYTNNFQGKPNLIVHSPGEYYRINCPFCRDTRKRLWINHAWGVPDQATGTRNRWLAICYNENCLSEPEYLKRLTDLTTRYLRRARAGRVQIPEGQAPPPDQPIDLPSDFQRLHQLPGDHHARKYIRSRGFDPDVVSKAWGVGFSREACPWSSGGRLVIPIFQGPREISEYRGWQARAIAEGDDPKYYTARGLKKSHYLYGLHRVKSKGPVIICEGPTDAWRIDRNAVALLGKTASNEQVRLIHKHFAGRPLIILLDSDATSDSVKLKERISQVRRMSLLSPDDALVEIATLPQGGDPGDSSREVIQEVVRDTLHRAHETDSFI